MAATYDWSTSKQKMTLGVRPDKKLPPGLQAGLRKVAEAYIPDLAYSLANPGTNKNQTDPARHKVVVKDGFPEVVSNNVVVKAFMRSIFSKEVEIAEFRGSVQGHLFNSLWTKGAPEGDQESIDWVVKFLRLVDGLDNGLDLQKAKQEDRDAAQWKAFLDATSSLVGQIPGHGKVATGVKKLVGLTYPLYNAAYKKPANQAKAVKIIRQDNYDRQQYLRVIVTQALIKRGDLKPPANAEWYQDGHVVPGSAFTKWFRENAHKHHMRSGESLRVYAKKLVDVYGKRVP